MQPNAVAIFLQHQFFRAHQPFVARDFTQGLAHRGGVQCGDRRDIVMLRRDVAAQPQAKGGIVAQLGEGAPDGEELVGGQPHFYAPLAEQPGGQAG